MFYSEMLSQRGEEVGVQYTLYIQYTLYSEMLSQRGEEVSGLRVDKVYYRAH
jgi:hypothetical protein